MVSVILPNYNHARFLEKRISSILSQTYQDFELIILDDCSTDESRSIIERYSKHPRVSQIVFNEKNSGSPFSQWNKGLELAKGDFIWFAESDDYADEKFIERLLPAFQDQQVGIAFCSSYWIDDKGALGDDYSLYDRSFSVNGQDIFMEEFVSRCPVPNASSALIRKKYIGQQITQLYKFRYCGDWIFYADVMTRSNLWYLNEKLNYFRFHHNNSSRQALQKGMWTDEGIHVLGLLPKINAISVRDIKNIFNSWSERINQLPGRLRRIRLRLMLVKYIMLAAKPLITPKI